MFAISSNVVVGWLVGLRYIFNEWAACHSGDSEMMDGRRMADGGERLGCGGKRPVECVRRVLAMVACLFR